MVNEKIKHHFHFTENLITTLMENLALKLWKIQLKSSNESMLL